MIKLPSGVEINSLINDLRILSWEAADVLLSYSKILKDSNYESNILRNDNYEDPNLHPGQHKYKKLELQPKVKK